MATARPSRWRRSRATTRRRACRRGRPRSSRATSTGAIRSPCQHVLSATGHRPRSAGRRPHACSGSGSGSEFGSEFGQQLDLGLGRRLGLSLGPGLGLDLGRSGSVSSRLHATPKSAILISPQSESSRLAHLMSRWTWGLGAGESVTLAAPHGRTAASLPHEAPARVECAAQPAAWRLGPRRPGQRAVAPPRRALSTAWWTMRQLACNQSSPRSVPAHTAAICASSSPVPWWRSTWCRLVLHSSRSRQGLPVGGEWDTLILQAALCGEAGRAGR